MLSLSDSKSLGLVLAFSEDTSTNGGRGAEAPRRDRLGSFTAGSGLFEGARLDPSLLFLFPFDAPLLTADLDFGAFFLSGACPHGAV